MVRIKLNGKVNLFGTRLSNRTDYNIMSVFIWQAQPQQNMFILNNPLESNV